MVGQPQDLKSFLAARLCSFTFSTYWKLRNCLNSYVIPPLFYAIHGKVIQESLMVQGTCMKNLPEYYTVFFAVRPLLIFDSARFASSIINAHCERK